MMKVLCWPIILLALAGCSLSSSENSIKEVANFHFTKYEAKYDPCPDSVAANVNYVECKIDYVGFDKAPKIYVNGIKLYVDHPGLYQIPIIGDKLCYTIEGERNTEQDIVEFMITNDQWSKQINQSIKPSSSLIKLTGSHNILPIEYAIN